MRYGNFDDQRREYVITTPLTPLPWINYLGNQDFFSLRSNTGGGYSFFRDAKLLRLTRYRYNNSPADSNGHYFYIQDSGTVWNPGFMPTRTPLERYSCRHGLGYTIVEGCRNGVNAKQEIFVPLEDPCEVTRLTLTNKSLVEKHLELFSLVEFCLWNALEDMSNFQRNFSTGEIEVEGSAIYHKTEYRERRDHYAVFGVNAPIAGFDTDRDAFCGTCRGFSDPETVYIGQSHHSIAYGWAPIGSHHIHIDLQPGEQRSLIFLLGYCENCKGEKFSAPGVINKTPAMRLLEKYRTDAQVDQALDALHDYWDKLLGHFVLSSNDKKLNRMVNIWNQYQCMITFNMSRSASYFESGLGRGMGFRDSCQDLLGFVHLVPERARARILDIAATQFPDGSTYHQYQPLTKRGNADIGSGFNDDPLWLIAGVSAYLRETGDFSVLAESCAFNNDPATAAPLLEHLRRSFQFTVEHIGPHGLPLIGRADWNDCLNLNCFSHEPGESFQTFGPSDGPVAESVLIAGMFVLFGGEYAEICRHLSLADEAARAEKEILRMKKTVLSTGWDGNWFLRAYDAASQPVGSCSCSEGQIYIEPQGMCVMAGIGLEDGRAHQALESVHERLDSEYGIVLLQPAYTAYHPELGEISSYPPGYKENAGIFCHVNPWVSCAETILGHGTRAFEVYRRTCPAWQEDHSEIRRTEPYVYCQMVAGKDAPTFGEGKNSWLTGTAAWSFVNISQYILGIQPTLDGLRVDPCLPADMPGFTITRIYRGATYHITVDNSAGAERGVSSVTINGRPQAGTLLPLLPPGGDAEILVTLK